jgi:hypothetical protein
MRLRTISCTIEFKAGDSVFVYAVRPTVRVLDLGLDQITALKYKRMGLWRGVVVSVCDNGMVLMKMDRDGGIYPFHPESLRMNKV